MSNTGQKGITYLKGQGVYKVTVGWKGKVVTRYVRGRYRADMPKAVQIRNSLEKALGKPRTSEILRSFGVAQGKVWRRRPPQAKAKTRRRAKPKARVKAKAKARRRR